MFNALVVSKDVEGQTSAAVTQISMGDLPDGEVVVAVEYSTVNWKDGACMGSGEVWLEITPTFQEWISLAP